MNTTTNLSPYYLDELKILERIATYSSRRLQVDYDSLYAYLYERINRPFKNFRKDLNKDYLKYFEISMRLYALNIIRDKCFNSNFNTGNLRLIAKIRKWGIAGAAKRLPYSEEYLRNLYVEYRQSQMNNTVQLEEVADYISAPQQEINPYVEFVASLGGLENVKKIPVDQLTALWQEFK